MKWNTTLWQALMAVATLAAAVAATGATEKWGS